MGINKTDEEFQEEIKVKNPHVEVLEKYKGVSTKILCRCSYCKKEKYSTPNIILKGKMFACCYQKINKSKSNKDFVEDLKNKNPNVIALGEYETEHIPILFKCLFCGNEWMREPKVILSGRGCPKCCHIRTANAKTQDMFDFLYNIQNKYPNINVYGKFVNRTTPIKCECLICGELFEKSPYELEKGYGCRCLKQKSKGEMSIKNWLDKYKIQYVMYKTYPNLLGSRGGKLSYDFYIPQLNILIEYQGQFHDGSTTLKYGYQTNENLLRQQEHDRRKREYAKDNNIKLIEIWYWDYEKIEKILTKELLEKLNNM